MNRLKQQATAYTDHCILVVLRENNGVGAWGSLFFFFLVGGRAERKRLGLTMLVIMVMVMMLIGCFIPL